MNYLNRGIASLMNLTTEGNTPLSDVFFLNFNQDCSSIAVGSKSGCRLYALKLVDKEVQNVVLYENNEIKEVCIFERLFSSALVAIVSLLSPRKLLMYHFRKGNEICSYSYTSTILSVKLNRERVVVCLHQSLYIHNIKDMSVVHIIADTPTNPTGLCALSAAAENCFLAYPGATAVGEVQIFDALNLTGKIIIPAHDNPLAAMQFDSSGKKIATASVRGTVIRVFNVGDGSKIMEFRRGMTVADIYSLSFSSDSMFLCASSNTETVHVFKLENSAEAPKPTEENQGWIDYIGKTIMSSTNYLPSQVSEMMKQERANATVHLPFANLKNICALTTIDNVSRVLIATASGYLYVYDINLTPDGRSECSLHKQHKLIDYPIPEEPENNPEHAPGGISGMGTASSYAATVKKDEKQEASSPYDELVAASGGLIGDPPAGLDSPLRIDDESEFPPVTQRFDS